MCFSATASFTASACLAIIGTATLKKTHRLNEIPIALIPIIFSIQQFIEGLVWVSLRNGDLNGVMLGTVGFLFFAFWWWPVYGPFMAFSLEPDQMRKKYIAVLGAVGLLVGTLLFAGFLNHPAPAYIANRCLVYPISIPFSKELTYLYVVAAVGSGIISTRSSVRIFSLLLGITAAIAWYVYTIHFTSVWCFFAAGISFVLYFATSKRPLNAITKPFAKAMARIKTKASIKVKV